MRPRLLMVTTAIGCAFVGGCAGAGAPAQPAAPPSASSDRGGPPPLSERFTPDVPGSLRVQDPKDARGIAACDLLTPAQLAELGLDPASARNRMQRYGESCVWLHAEASVTAGAGISTDPDSFKLPDLYRTSPEYIEPVIGQVAGHPTLRLDAEPETECVLYVGVADEQVLDVEAYSEARTLPDPCAPTRRMAEMVLSNLPPLR